MFKYVIKRLLLGIVTLFALVTITFFLMHIIPGSPFSGEMSKLPAETKQILISSYQLDKPIFVQYLTYLQNLMRGDFGTSLVHKGTKVITLIATGLPYTMNLGLVAFILAMVLGILLGTVSAFSKKKWVQGLSAFIGTIGVSVPSFLFALFLMYLFGVWLRVLPMIGLTSWQNYIMPSFALALAPIAMISRLVKSSLSEEIHQDYITLARSKGTPYAKVIWKHALKNAVIPVITYAGPLLASLLTGSFVVESMFSIPGIGSQFVASVSNRDYTLIMALTILYGSLIIIVNIITDMITAVIDPRIRLK
jgi:oligopeptide transport system permease protein